MRNPYPHIAVRLAAKEAGFKALAGDIEARAIAWQEMEVVHDEHRRPTLRLHGRARQRAVALAKCRCTLSIVFAEQEPFSSLPANVNAVATRQVHPLQQALHRRCSKPLRMVEGRDQRRHYSAKCHYGSQIVEAMYRSLPDAALK